MFANEDCTWDYITSSSISCFMMGFSYFSYFFKSLKFFSWIGYFSCNRGSSSLFLKLLLKHEAKYMSMSSLKEEYFDFFWGKALSFCKWWPSSCVLLCWFYISRSADTFLITSDRVLIVRLFWFLLDAVFLDLPMGEEEREFGVKNKW